MWKGANFGDIIEEVLAPPWSGGPGVTIGRGGLGMGVRLNGGFLGPRDGKQDPV